MSETETLLFIGGVLDGRRLQVPTHSTRYLGMRGPSKGSDVYERAMLEQYSSAPPVRDAVHFFRLKGMSETDAVRLLLAGYKPR